MQNDSVGAAAFEVSDDGSLVALTTTAMNSKEEGIMKKKMIVQESGFLRLVQIAGSVESAVDLVPGLLSAGAKAILPPSVRVRYMLNSAVSQYRGSIN